jgi:hypothetical protein
LMFYTGHAVDYTGMGHSDSYPPGFQGAEIRIAAL